MEAFLSADTVNVARLRPEFSAVIDRLMVIRENLIVHGIEPPDKQAGYYHNFFCREHGVQLLWTPGCQVFQCPVTFHNVQGEPYFAASRWFENRRLADGAYQTAMLFRLTGDFTALDLTRDILTKYANRYAFFAESENGGKLTYQSLDEATWLLPIAWACGLIRDSIMPAEFDLICKNLIQPAAVLLMKWSHSIPQNIQCWRGAALHAAAMVLQSDDLISYAIRGPEGLVAQLNAGVTDDGFWQEGSLSYHFYALWPLLWTAITCSVVRDHPKLPEMLEAPFRLALPDLSLPTFNDCWPECHLEREVAHGTPEAAAFYELGYSWYRRPAFAALLKRIYRQRVRGTLEALLFGEYLPLSDQLPKLRSFALASTGIGMLRDETNSEDGLSTVLKFSSHGGMHEHADQLSISIYSGTTPICRDYGTTGYGDAELTSWYRSTLAHNTLIVDERDQPFTFGDLIAFNRSENTFNLLAAQVAWNKDNYQGVQTKRILIQRKGRLIDIVLASADREHIFDLVQHFEGHLEEQKKLPVSDVCQLYSSKSKYFKLDYVLSEREPVTFELTNSKNRIVYQTADTATAYVGRSVGHPAWTWTPLVLRRIVGSAAAFVSVLYSDAVPTGTVHLLQENNALIIKLNLADETEIWRIATSDQIVVSLDIHRHIRNNSTIHIISNHALVTYDFDGAPQYCTPLGMALRQLGLKVENASPNNFTLEWLSKLKTPAVLHFHFPHYFFTTEDHSITEKLLQEWEVKLKLARRFGVGIVWTVHNLYPHESLHPDIQHKARLLLSRLATAIITHCQNAADQVAKRFSPPLSCEIIPHGGYADIYSMIPKAVARECLGLNEASKIFLHFGNIRPYKGTERLIRAFQSLSNPGAKLVIAGKPFFNSGDLREKIIRLAASDSRIILRIKNIPEAELPLYFGSADFIVAPYIDVLTSGNVPLAQSLGRPVIAPALGCLPEMTDSDTAILYDPATAQALEAALIKAVSIDTSQMEIASRRHALNLDWHSIAQRTLAIYHAASKFAESTKHNFAEKLAGSITDSFQKKEDTNEMVHYFIHEVLPKRLLDFEPIPGLIQFTLIDSGSQWSIDTKKKQISQKSAFPPYLKLEMTGQDLIALLEGKLNPITGFMSARIRVEGDRRVASKIASLFAPLQSPIASLHP